MNDSYDVFISYSSADRPWARKLADALTGRGLKVFFDKDSLREGEGWEAQLQASVLGSRQLLCLWSAKVDGGSWVHREASTFMVRDQGGEPASQPALPLIVALDASRNPYGAQPQGFVDEPLQRAYFDGIATLAAADWQALVDRIERALRRSGDAVTIPVALLTLTLEQAKGIAADERADIEERLGIAPAALEARYGADRRDWQPFGNGTTIRDALEQAQLRINKAMAPKSLAWALPDDSFWADLPTARAFAAQMAAARRGVIVIDPVALLLPKVLSRVSLFDACKRIDTIAIVVVPPFAASPLVASFRRWVEEYGTAIVQPYFEPPMAADEAVVARCGLAADDPEEIRRLVQASMGHYNRLALRREPAANTWTAVA